jgi:hypothetical protein
MLCVDREWEGVREKLACLFFFEIEQYHQSHAVEMYKSRCWAFMLYSSVSSHRREEAKSAHKINNEIGESKIRENIFTYINEFF